MRAITVLIDTYPATSIKTRAASRGGFFALLLLLMGSSIGCDSADVDAPGSSVEGFVTSRGVQLRYIVNFPEGDGPFPTIVNVPGSGDVPASHPGLRRDARKFLEPGYASVRYDKRGTGASGGEIVGVSLENSLDTVPLLADDMLAVIDEILDLPEVDTDRVGLFGISQASWVMPLIMANEAELDFAVYQSAGAIQVGIHLIFEVLSIHQGLPFDEATKRFEEMVEVYDGPLGFDQRPLLEAEQRPMLFLMGEKDRNGPYGANRDEILRLADLGVDVTLVSYPDGQHGLDGTDFWPDLWNWLSAKGFHP